MIESKEESAESLVQNSLKNFTWLFSSSDQFRRIPRNRRRRIQR